MNCEPGQLARIINTREMTKMGFTDKVIRVLTLHGVSGDGYPAWSYEGPRLHCKCGCGYQVIAISDNVLRPIIDPGPDAVDQTLTWKKVPSTPAVPVAPVEMRHYNCQCTTQPVRKE